MPRRPDEPVRLTRIYTRGGDAGETSLGDGSRVSKLDPLVEAYGAVDELNSLRRLGAGGGARRPLARAGPERALRPRRRPLGARIAEGDGKLRDRRRRRSTGSKPTATRRMHRLPELRSFVLPGGTEAAARLHVARAVCRRAEREVLATARERPINPLALVYLNRLSDLLFILARARAAAGRRRERALASRRRARSADTDAGDRARRRGARARGRALLDDLGCRGRSAVDAGHGRRSTTSATWAIRASYPFTRGVYPSMYRGRLWTMRQFAGFGTAAETNERFRYLLEHGQTGLSTAFDMPTLMGYDSDHPRSLGEVGREGVAIDSLEDMETLFAGIPLGEVSTSMTINSPAAMLLAFYAVCRRGAGRVARQAARDDPDGHPQGVHRAEGVHLPAGAVDAAGDGHGRVLQPRRCRCGIRSRSRGYHIREAGSTAAQELAFTLADGFTYVEWALERGLDVDEFAPRLSFFFNAHLDFFEEIAKYRAARRIWARTMRERLRREEPAVVADALPHADGGRVADGAAAGGEHRAHGDRGARRGARRHAVAAHELVRRGAGAADRGRGADRACAPSR